MSEIQLQDAKELSRLLDAVSRQFGFWRTLFALVVALLERRRQEHELALLDNATRRDIGLPEKEIAPNVLWIVPWDVGR